MDDWERLDLTGRQLTELIRSESDQTAIDDLIRQKNELNMLKRQMAVQHGCWPGEMSTLEPRG